jgi:hypothetical protein
MENNQPRKSYYSITPADVRYCTRIVDGAKLLYGEITALCNERGYCWATNQYFADLYKNETRTIARWIASLLKEEFIYIDSRKGIRKIFLAHKFNASEVYDTMPAPERDEPEAEITTTKKKEKKPKQVKKEIEKKYTEEDRSLAELLLQKIIYNFPTFENKKVNVAEWADEIRKLREIDKATREQIFFMITWLQGGEIVHEGKPPRHFEPHDFWSKNILSAKKMRKQWFENLVPQLQDSVKKIVKKSTVTQL